MVGRSQAFKSCVIGFHLLKRSHATSPLRSRRSTLPGRAPVLRRVLDRDGAVGDCGRCRSDLVRSGIADAISRVGGIIKDCHVGAGPWRATRLRGLKGACAPLRGLPIARGRGGNDQPARRRRVRGCDRGRRRSTGSRTSPAPGARLGCLTRAPPRSTS